MSRPGECTCPTRDEATVTVHVVGEEMREFGMVDTACPVHGEAVVAAYEDGPRVAWGPHFDFRGRS